MYWIKYALEKSLFGVCSYLGDKMGLSTRSVRLSFMYLSFFTLGSPIIIYFILAFWMNIKRYSQESRTRVWDL
ncbi:MAG: PspC domain-containing protein [Bacteroidota bacterium]